MKSDQIEYFTDSGITYLSENRYETAAAGRKNWKRSRYYRKNRKEFLALEESYREYMKNEKPALTIAESGECGMGLFAGDTIPQGAIIGQYTGIVRKGRKDISQTAFSWHFPVRLNLFTPLELTAAIAGNELRYVNHSISPNLEPDHLLWEGKWIIIFRSARDIPAGEELTIDYGPDYWTHPDREIIISQEQFEALQKSKQR